jgi:hypothetical protein
MESNPKNPFLQLPRSLAPTCPLGAWTTMQLALYGQGMRAGVGKVTILVLAATVTGSPGQTSHTNQGGRLDDSQGWISVAWGPCLRQSKTLLPSPPREELPAPPPWPAS